MNDLIKAALTTTKKDARFAYVAPQYSQAKDIVWSYIKHYTAVLPGVAYNESELRVDFHNGSRIRLYGTENESRLRGLYFDGAVLDEYADIHPRVFDEILRPLLADRKGWAVFIGTPSGHNAFYAVYQQALKNPQEWFSMMLKSSTSGILDPEELAAAKRDMTDDAFEQEFECSFEAAIKGAVFGKEMKAAEDGGRITAVPYDPFAEVWTAWDLGIGDATAIWFAQQVGREVRIIDYYEARGAGIDHYVKVLKDKPYNYARHLLPHDADKTELGSGLSITEQLKSLGIRNTRVVKKLTLNEGLNIARMFIPKCVFDRKRCDQGIEALKVYRYEYDALTNTNSKRPVHNWASHCFHGDTKILTRHGPIAIMALPKTGEVLTLCGWRPYRSPRVSKRNARLVAVEFAGGYSVKCTPDHLFLTDSGWKSAESLMPGSRILSALTDEHSFSAGAFIESGRQTCTSKTKRIFTGMFGAPRSETYRRTATFITGMATLLTTGLKTLSALMLPNISLRLQKIENDAALIQHFQSLPETMPQSGTRAKPESNGTFNTPEIPQDGQSGKERLFLAPVAARSSWPFNERTATRSCTAQQTAKPARLESETLTITSVSKLDERADVWDITVPGIEHFSLDNGAVVHNSADAFRYLSIGFKPDGLASQRLDYPNLAMP